MNGWYDNKIDTQEKKNYFLNIVMNLSIKNS